MTEPDEYARCASSRSHSPKMVMLIVEERRKGRSLQDIGGQVGLCMESVRQILLRYSRAKAGVAGNVDAEIEPDDDQLCGAFEPMRAGHPTSLNAIWNGLERWRNGDATRDRRITA